MPFEGMDPSEIRRQAHALRTQAHAIANTVAAIDGIVGHMSQVWRGSDATEFVGWWQQKHRPALQAAQDSVSGLARSADNNAQQQESASGGGSGLTSTALLTGTALAGAGTVSIAGGSKSGSTGSHLGSTPPLATVPDSAITTPAEFSSNLLKAMGVPETKSNLQFLEAWCQREGGNWKNSATYNPLNTEYQLPGSANFGSHLVGQAGVQAYTSWDQGIQATIDTLRLPYYKEIVQALQSGDAMAVNDAGGLLSALMTWSGHSYGHV